MHLCKAPQQFGFERDNTIGLTEKVNTWEKDWVHFFSKHRLEFQLKLTNDAELQKLGEKLLLKLPEFFEGIAISPSLLHGDLWGGNTACTEAGEPLVFDPSSYYGHSEADLSIAGMFGGFTKEFYETYHAFIPKETAFEERQALYQLYHYLNHFNIFGTSYRPSCLAILHKFFS